MEKRFQVQVSPSFTGSEGKEFPLHDAVMTSSPEIVEDLIKSGEDPNQRDPYGATPLRRVCCNSQADKMVHVLVKCGADMLIRDGYGTLPFQVAQRFGDVKICQAFIDLGFSLQKCDRMRNGTYEILSSVQLFQPYATEELQLLKKLGVDLTTMLSSKR